MSVIRQAAAYMRDEVRLVQGFMVCRLSGILLASVVIARRIPLHEVGVFEMLMFCGYLFTFFWSEAMLKAFLARKSAGDAKKEISSFLLMVFLFSCGAMMVLYLGREIFIPLITDRPGLEGLSLFVVFQSLVIPIGMVPFLRATRPLHVILLSAYVLAGPAFAAYMGTDSYPGLIGVLIGLLSYSLVGFVWILFTTPLSRDFALGVVWKQVWPIAWPLMLYTIAAGLARSFDAWLVARHFDDQVFAVFRYGAREFPLVLALAGGMSTAMIARLLAPPGVSELKKRTTRLMHTCYPLIACCMLVSVPLFVLLFGEPFRESAWIFNVYLLLTLFQLVFPQTVMTARGDTRWLWYIAMIELAVNVVASLVLLHFFGLIGIAWGTLIAFFVEKVLMLIFVKWKYRLRPGEVVSFKTWTTYACILVLTYFMALWIFGR